jgi:type VI secretion system secreted protein VgrG
MPSVSNYTFQAGKYTNKDLLVEKFHGKESISELFKFTVYVATKKIQIDFQKVIGKPAQLSILRTSGKDRFINGIVDEIEYISETKAHIHYRFEVVPSVWLLKYRQDNRIFQDKTVEDIIEKVLTKAGITSENYEFSLQGNYQPIDYCVQYRESDFNFISRLMEQDGIFYYFRHDDEKSAMVFADHSMIHKEIDSPSSDDSPSKIVYKAKTGKLPDKEHVFSYKYYEKIRPGLASLRDYNFVKPTLDLECSSKYEKDTKLEIHEYPGSYKWDDTGGDLATVRMEALQVDRQVSRGAGTCRSFNPGFKFTLAGHQNKKFNCENLLISVVHRGSQKQVLGEEAAAESKEEIQYENEFQALLIPDKKSDMTLFRPHRKTPKPRINGSQTAVVVGSAGEEIYTDEHGRIKVQFHWDRKGEKNEKSSCWIRVAQLWAGAGWGGLFIPRIGQEVVVSFLEGDPDQPLVVGCVYNGDNDPPYTLPDDMTKSTIKSNTSLGGDGKKYNELVMEDSEGMTQVVLYNAYGHKITMDEESQSLKIKTHDKNTIRLDDMNRNISIKTTEGHKFKLDDEKKRIVIKSTDGHKFEISDDEYKILTQTKDGHIFLFDDENEKIELTTKDGHTAIFDDQNKKIGITTSDGHAVTLDDAGQSITLEDAGGSHMFKIDISGEKLIVSTDSGAIDILAPSGELSLEAAEINIKASGDLNLKGLNITTDADMNLTQKGGMDLTAEGGMTCKVKGGVMTDVEGGAKTTIKGGIVMIN